MIEYITVNGNNDIYNELHNKTFLYNILNLYNNKVLIQKVKNKIKELIIFWS